MYCKKAKIIYELKKCCLYLRHALNQKIVILGVLKNETCYKTGRVSTRDFTVYHRSGKRYEYRVLQMDLVLSCSWADWAVLTFGALLKRLQLKLNYATFEGDFLAYLQAGVV